MTITFDLPRELEARFTAEARERGVSLGILITEAMLRYHGEMKPGQVACDVSRLPATADELDRRLDEAASFMPRGASLLSDLAFGREGLYTREDDWNLPQAN